MNSMTLHFDTLRKILIKTKDGVFTAYFSARGLVRLDFPSNEALPRTLDSGHGAFPGGSRWLAMTQSALKRALDAKRPRRLPPLDLTAGTAFQQSVWKALCQIGPSQTMTYAEVAKAIGRPHATRAVGQACGANLIPVLIPCHRVVASRGGLGGFSAGLDWKRKLLHREGFNFSNDQHPSRGGGNRSFSSTWGGQVA